MEVGVRDLRSGLAAILDRVKEGEDAIITERGKPIARLTARIYPTKIQDLIDRGLATPPQRPRTRWSDIKPIKVKGSVSDIVIEQRR